MDAAQSSRASLLPSRRSKRRRTSTASCSFCAAQRSAGRAKLAVSERAPVSYLATTITYTRDWADLGDGPAGLIANRVLAYDVADYVRFRAVCSSWRRCCAEPLAHGGLDRRFHPWRWMMLQERHSTTNRRRFLNTSTGECIQVDIPELRDHNVLAVTHESLLVLLHVDCTNLRLLNPLTRHLTQLPPLLTLLSPEECHDLIPSRNLHNKFKAWGSGILNDDSTVVLRFKFNTRYMGMAKPGDMCWTRLETPVLRAASMFAGRFYCFTKDGIMVLKDQPPRLEVAAKLHIRVSGVCDSAHLVDCAGELMLVHRRFSRLYDRNNVAKRRYDTYRVDLDAGTLCRVKSFGGGGHALFIGMTCSFSVPIEGFPVGSISGDTIYLNVDIDESHKTEGYSLADRTITPAVRSHHWAAQPYTLVDCLAFCNTHIWSGLK